MCKDTIHMIRIEWKRTVYYGNAKQRLIKVIDGDVVKTVVERL